MLVKPFIRPLEVNDLPYLLELEKDSFNSSDRWKLEWYITDIVRVGGHCLVMDNGFGHVAGCIWVMPENDNRTLYIASLAVFREYRGHGLGKMLVNHVQEYVGKSKIRNIRLHVRKRNAAAKAIYKDLGFKQTGSETPYFKDGAGAFIYEWVNPNVGTTNA